MFRFKRISRYYTIEKKKDSIYISHQPRWLFYFANKQKFYRERIVAYQQLASMLKDPKLWPKRQLITSRSITIDFSKDTELATIVPFKWYDKPSTLLLWALNVFNWRPSRVMKLIKILRAKEVSSFQLSRDTFIELFEGR